MFVSLARPTTHGSGRRAWSRLGIAIAVILGVLGMHVLGGHSMGHDGWAPMHEQPAPAGLDTTSVTAGSGHHPAHAAGWQDAAAMTSAVGTTADGGWVLPTLAAVCLLALLWLVARWALTRLGQGRRCRSTHSSRRGPPTPSPWRPRTVDLTSLGISRT